MRIGAAARSAFRLGVFLFPTALAATASAGSPVAAVDEATLGITNHRVSRGIHVRHPESVVGPLAPSPEAVPAAIPSGILLEYHGGRVISHVQVVLVGWGTLPSYVTTTAPAYFQTLVNSRFMDWHGEYDTTGVKPTDFGTAGMGTSQHIGRGTVVPTPIKITPSVTSKTVDDTQISAEIQKQITAGVLPQPKVEADGSVDTIYFMFFPSTITITQGTSQSCVAFCGYHGTFTSAGKSIYYAVIPDMSTGGCASGCGGTNPADSYGVTNSHELSEAVTDAEVGIVGNASDRPLSWYDDSQACSGKSCGENGDICANPSVFPSGSQLDRSLGIPVQKIWSQRLYNCVAQDPTLPICNGSNHPCNGCASSSDCGGATPVCDTTPGSTTSGQCIAPKCTTNADCTTLGKNVCDTTTGSCRGCAKDAECSGATPKCDVSTTTCVACLASADCSGTKPVCNTATKTCKGCSASSDCAAPQVCDPGTGACVGCETNADCKSAGAPVCDTGTRTCVAGSTGGSGTGGTGTGTGGGTGTGTGGTGTGTGGGTGTGTGGSGKGTGTGGGTGAADAGASNSFDTPAPASGCSTAPDKNRTNGALAGVVFAVAAMIRRRGARARVTYRARGGSPL
jgi:hypothetical protein